MQPFAFGLEWNWNSAELECRGNKVKNPVKINREYKVAAAFRPRRPVSDLKVAPTDASGSIGNIDASGSVGAGFSLRLFGLAGRLM